MSDAPIPYEYIDAEANAGRMGSRLMALVVEGKRTRLYLSPTEEHERAASISDPAYKPQEPCRGTFASNAQGRFYGYKTFGDYFTPRQLEAVKAFADSLEIVVMNAENDALAAGLESGLSLSKGGKGAIAYGEAIRLFLSLTISKLTDYNSRICGRIPDGETIRNTFPRQGIQMSWEFCEANPIGNSTGSSASMINQVARAIETLPARGIGIAAQSSAQLAKLGPHIISTDPPYYNNVAYADLADFFYVWLRILLRRQMPDAFATALTPKVDELIANPYRHGGEVAAEQFFLEGMTKALENLVAESHPAFPVSIYYAYRQTETDETATTNTGWETFLTSVVGAGFVLTGTWPLRTERTARTNSYETNSLASTILLVCRKRDPDAATISRRDFLRELQAVLPDALVDMTRGGENSPVAPVDLSQAIIGPGMGIFSKYKAVLEADGKAMSVKTALQLINRFLADDEFDPETQFCLQWLETNNWKTGSFGSADILAQAKGTSLSSMNREGLLKSGGGIVELIRWQDLDSGWQPERGNLTPIWQALHQMIASLQLRGEQPTGALLAAMPAVSGRVRTLAYRLYTLVERMGFGEEARPYNELIGSWAAIELAAVDFGPIETQVELF